MAELADRPICKIMCPGCGVKYYSPVDRDPLPHERCVWCWKKRAVKAEGLLLKVSRIATSFIEDELEVLNENTQ